MTAVTKRKPAKGKRRVVKIKTKNDISEAKGVKRLFCRFKMDGCSHCVNSQGDWDELCKQVEHMLTPDCMIAEIESKMLPMFDLGDYSPNGFPSHAFFENGQFVKDAEDRSLEGLLQILKDMRYIPVKSVEPTIRLTNPPSLSKLRLKTKTKTKPKPKPKKRQITNKNRNTRIRR